CGMAAPEDTEAELGTRQQAVTCAPSLSAAAITQQIVSVTEPTQLTIELVTLTPEPYELTAASLSFPPGFVQRSLQTTSCSDSTGVYRCGHQAVIEATTACTGTGNYVLSLRYVAMPGSGCAPTGQTQQIPFSLTTENFCYGPPING